MPKEQQSLEQKTEEIELSNRSTKQVCWRAGSKADREKDARGNRNNENYNLDKAKIAKDCSLFRETRIKREKQSDEKEDLIGKF